jgi:hypothetical protein
MASIIMLREICESQSVLKTSHTGVTGAYFYRFIVIAARISEKEYASSGFQPGQLLKRLRSDFQRTPGSRPRYRSNVLRQANHGVNVSKLV